MLIKPDMACGPRTFALLRALKGLEQTYATAEPEMGHTSFLLRLGPGDHVDTIQLSRRLVSGVIEEWEARDR